MGTRTTSSCSLLFLLLFFFSTNTHLSSAADTLSSGQSLSGNQSLVSKQGNFELGFFRPGTSPNYYIAIWYKKISIQNKTTVWVANRNTPLNDLSSSELILLGNGNLVLFDKSKIPIWSTNTILGAINSTEVVLGDDGNLVVRDGANPSNVFWQSFDHPADTWLPGGKLRYDNLTKTARLLISWKNLENPAEGRYSMELDPVGKQYLSLWNRSTRYWTSGGWDGQRFSLVPEMRLNYIYNFSYVSTENESYFLYSVYNKSIISRFVMGLTGQVRQYTWLENSQTWNLFWSQPRKQCEVYAFCGAFGSCDERGLPFCRCLLGFEPRSLRDWNLSDSSGGCVRKNPLQCGDRDRFSSVINVKLPDNPVSLAVGNAEECKSRCLSNCSCNAYSYLNGCSIWNGNLLNLQLLSDGDNEGRDIYVKIVPSDVQSSDGKKGPPMAVIGGVVAGVVVSICLLLLLWRCRRRSVGASKTVEGSLVAFTYKDLQNATKNFSEKLGGGGFGSVFKGTLADSTVIAAKKLEGISQGEKQFRTEVSTIGAIQHVNLVRLRGFCSEGTKRLLVYDYMLNGSLDAHLFHQKDSKVLDWKTRYQIALGTARGLAYLHEECRDCIIHCDIKPENILLDADFCPKVADFGLAKLIGREFSRVLTTMRGTRGYLAPEWISGVAITAKADVYSYGMMLFEVISGKRNSEQSDEGKVMFYPTWASNRIAEGEDVLLVADNRLEGEANVNELTRAFRVACWCIQDEESHRPSMGHVVQILEGVLEVNPPPIPRTLQVLVENEKEKHIHFFSESSSNRSSRTQTNTSSTSSQTKSSTSLKSSMS